MNNIKILDCTLRDGGFVNDWNFGHHAIYNICNRLISANIDIVELGFLNDSYAFDKNRTIMPHSKYLSEIFNITSTKKPMLVAMVIMGECGIENVGPCSETPVDGIRVVFKKSKIAEAFEFAEQVREKGYKVFLQPASVTDYTNEEMLSLISLTNAFNPVALYIVDTYGLMHKDKVLRYFNLMNDNLNPSIAVGYHSHNNYQLSYATAMDLLEVKTDRTVMIDSSLLGMGKGAGNLNTELIADYLNKYRGSNYDVLQILEIIDLEMLKIRQKHQWGYSFDGFISASNECHPGYVNYLTNKKTLSIKSVNVILSRLKEGTKTTYDKQQIEKLYLDFQSIETNDKEVVKYLSNQLANREILIMAPGSSLVSEKSKVIDFISKKSPIIITINHHSEDYKADFVFVNNAKRFSQMSEFLDTNKEIKIIVTSNITPATENSDYLYLNYSQLLVEGDVDIISANATLMLLKTLKRVGVKSVNIAGFDGFSANAECNYAENYLSYNTNDDFSKQNRLVKEKVTEFRNLLDLNFITSSKYL